MVGSSRLLYDGAMPAFRKVTVKRQIKLTARNVNEFGLSKNIYDRVYRVSTQRSRPMVCEVTTAFQTADPTATMVNTPSSSQGPRPNLDAIVSTPQSTGFKQF